MASGSSVPEWPDRGWALTRRRRATTSWLVTRRACRRPAARRARSRASYAPPDRSCETTAASTSAIGASMVKPAASRCPPPPSATATAPTSADERGAQRHPHPVVGLLAEARHLRLGGRAEPVDQPLDVVVRDVMCAQIILRDPRRDRGGVRVDPDQLRPGQHRGRELQVGEGVLVEELAGQAVDGQIESGELLGQREQRRGGARVGEPTGVGDDAGVEAPRAVAIERPSEAAGQFAHDHGSRRGARVDHVHGAEAVVGGVMVDHDQIAVVPRPLRRPLQLGETAQRPAVEGEDRRRLRRELRRRHRVLDARDGPVVGGDGQRLGPRHDAVDAVGPAQVVEGERGPERVAVGVDMAHEPDRSTRTEHRGGRRVGAVELLRGAHCDVSPAPSGETASGRDRVRRDRVRRDRVGGLVVGLRSGQRPR